MLLKGISPVMIAKHATADETAIVLGTTCKCLLLCVGAQIYLAFPFGLEQFKARPGQLYLLGCHVYQMSAQG